MSMKEKLFEDKTVGQAGLLKLNKELCNLYRYGGTDETLRDKIIEIIAFMNERDLLEEGEGKPVTKDKPTRWSDRIKQPSVSFTVRDKDELNQMNKAMAGVTTIVEKHHLISSSQQEALEAGIWNAIDYALFKDFLFEDLEDE